MKCILPNLVISNYRGCRITSYITERGVTHVLSLSKDASSNKENGEQKDGVRYALCHLEDHKGVNYDDVLENMCSIDSFVQIEGSQEPESKSESKEERKEKPKLLKMSEYIEEGLKPGHALLVNCEKAWCRFPFICMSILITHFNCTLLESLIILNCVGVVRCNIWESMVTSLSKLAEKCGKEGREGLPEGFLVEREGFEGTVWVNDRYFGKGDKKEWLKETEEGIECFKWRMKFMEEMKMRKEEKKREEEEGKRMTEEVSNEGKGSKKRKAGDSESEADNSAPKKTKLRRN